MRTLGMYMAIFGLGSAIMNSFDYNFTLLMWIDNWGTTTGWIIRIALIVIGALLFFLSPAPEEEAPEA